MAKLVPALALLTASFPVLADPILSVDITLAPGEDYATAARIVRKAGATATSLSLMWDELETRPGTFSPAENWPLMANLFFPATGLDYTLTLSVIDTTADRRPADLQGLAWDDPAVIARFNTMAEGLLTRIPRLSILSITVGNEVDVALAAPEDIAAFARFLAAVRPGLQALRPDVPLGTKLTFAGLADPRRDLTPLINASDALFVTYYPLGPGFRLRPLTDLPGDLQLMTRAAGDKPLWLMETGYPSAGCDGAAKGQADFVIAMQNQAKTQPQIALWSYTFLTDLPPKTVSALTGYYDQSDPCFAAYLGSLGLRDAAGAAKPALKALAP